MMRLGLILCKALQCSSCTSVLVTRALAPDYWTASCSHRISRLPSTRTGSVRGEPRSIAYCVIAAINSHKSQYLPFLNPTSSILTFALRLAPLQVEAMFSSV
ncbi:hypothetical protein F5Y02DRAFT_287491 [Annulohypoxylon stygium]|nr:hypothetical protein F5Y02DRAFT_287491 [Annulohypoxylon stygium]